MQSCLLEVRAGIVLLQSLDLLIWMTALGTSLGGPPAILIIHRDY